MIRVQIEKQKEEEEAKRRFVEKLRQRLRMLNVIKEGPILENEYQSMTMTMTMTTKEEKTIIKEKNEEREKSEVDGDKGKDEILFDPKYDPFFLSQVLKRR
jgi:uncharacterized LabA/DUF88 family protein